LSATNFSITAWVISCSSVTSVVEFPNIGIAIVLRCDGRSAVLVEYPHPDSERASAAAIQEAARAWVRVIVSSVRVRASETSPHDPARRASCDSGACRVSD
jgi:hypothetical protein